jgi:hypothetical protein
VEHTINIGIPQHNAPNISKIESTKFNDVLLHTNSVPLNGYVSHIHRNRFNIALCVPVQQENWKKNGSTLLSPKVIRFY